MPTVGVWAIANALGQVREPLVVKNRPGRRTLEGKLTQRPDLSSNANHVGYHIVAHLAVHQHFINAAGPVPHFVVFDQAGLSVLPESTPNS